MVDLRGTEELYNRDYARMRDSTGIDIDTVGRDTPMVLCRFDSDDSGSTWSMEALAGDRGQTWHVDGFINDYLANEASAVSIDKATSFSSSAD